jgi:hypothetical protein
MSLKKEYDEIIAEEERQKKLQKLKAAEEAAKKKEEEDAFFEEHDRRLADVLDEIKLRKSLIEVKDDFWKLGYITIGEIERDKATAYLVAKLEARWDIFVPNGTEELVDGMDSSYVKLPDHISEEYRSLIIELNSFKSGVYIQVNGFQRFRYRGPWDIKDFRALLIEDCKRRKNELPYSERKREADLEILWFRIMHPLTPLRKRDE